MHPVVPGGVVGFDDYGSDLPGVTRTIDGIVELHRGEIAEVWRSAPKQIFLEKAERGASSP